MAFGHKNIVQIGFIMRLDRRALNVAGSIEWIAALTGVLGEFSQVGGEATADFSFGIAPADAAAPAPVNFTGPPFSPAATIGMDLTSWINPGKSPYFTAPGTKSGWY
ncbi:MAG: hypothetical protein HC779_06295 [Phyllobacteriaceae bacterium]|nr:hypothetical protein [Phyllobacteriaceae bacterium]